VRYFAGDDGMATLLADLPAEDALAIYRVIDQAAHASCAEEQSLNNVRDAVGDDLIQQAVPDRTPGGQTMDQRRADAFTDLVLGPVLGQEHPTLMLSTVAATSARVIVDAETLAGVQSKPGELVGYGAITAEHVRELVDGDARWRRLLTDPVGGLLEVSPQRYRPGRRLAEFVVDRDVTCRFPGVSTTVCLCRHRSRSHHAFPVRPHSGGELGVALSIPSPLEDALGVEGPPRRARQTYLDDSQWTRFPHFSARLSIGCSTR